MRPRTRSTKALEPVPLELQVGPLVEVWDPTERSGEKAQRLWFRARNAWLEAHGLDSSAYGWERDVWPPELRYVRLLAWRWSDLDDDGQAAYRRRHDLPVDWSPLHLQRLGGVS